METDNLDSISGSTKQEVGVATPPPPPPPPPPPVGQLDWLKGPFLQSALCQVFQRFALEGDEESRRLIHKVEQN